MERVVQGRAEAQEGPPQAVLVQRNIVAVMAVMAAVMAGAAAAEVEQAVPLRQAVMVLMVLAMNWEAMAAMAARHPVEQEAQEELVMAMQAVMERFGMPLMALAAAAAGEHLQMAVLPTMVATAATMAAAAAEAEAIVAQPPAAVTVYRDLLLLPTRRRATRHRRCIQQPPQRHTLFLPIATRSPSRHGVRAAGAGERRMVAPVVEGDLRRPTSW